MASVQQRLPPGVYQIHMNGHSKGKDYLVVNREGMLETSASDSVPPGQFRLEYVDGSGAIRLATLDGKYLYPGIEHRDYFIEDESHEALKFYPINWYESAIQKDVKFEISTWTSDGVVTLREVGRDNTHMNVHWFDLDLRRSDFKLSRLVCLTNYEAYQVSEFSILRRAVGLKFEPVP